MQAEQFAAQLDPRLYHAWRAAGILADLMLYYFDREYKVELDASLADDSYGLPLAEQPAAIKLEVDRLTNQMAADYLGKLYPDYGFVGEESFEDDPGQLEKALFWCVDPICGSKGYKNKTPYYGTSIALISREKGPLLGVLNCPGLGLAGLGQAEKKRWLLRGAFAGRQAGGLNVAVSKNREGSPEQARVLEALNPVRVDYFTGVPPKSLQVIAGVYDLYFMLPKAMGGNATKIWDLAASAALAQAKGLVACDVYGDPLDLSGRGGHLMEKGFLLARDAQVRDLALTAMATLA